MQKIKIISLILVLGVVALYGSGCDCWYGEEERPPFQPPSAEEDQPLGNEAGPYYLTESNTVSVTTDEYHITGSPNDWTYKSGEWTSNKRETYGSLVKFEIPELKDFSKGTLHLRVQEYTNKEIRDKKCDFTKKFYIKKVTESWEPKTADWNTIASLQKSGEIVATFEVKPEDEEIKVEVPLKELMQGYGFTIDQVDESFCRVSFYSQNLENGQDHWPYVTVVW